MQVRHLMHHDVVRLAEDATLGVAEDIMRLGGVRHIPVVAGDRLVGIVSQRDLLRAAASSLLELTRETQREWLGTIAVRDVMTAPVHTIGPAQPAADIVALLLEHRIGCLPVVEDGRLVGIVSETDCLRYLARLLDIDATKHALPELPTGR
jgi:CBS domain-containing membrane protein